MDKEGDAVWRLDSLVVSPCLESVLVFRPNLLLSFEWPASPHITDGNLSRGDDVMRLSQSLLALCSPKGSQTCDFIALDVPTPDIWRTPARQGNSDCDTLDLSNCQFCFLRVASI